MSFSRYVTPARLQATTCIKHGNGIKERVDPTSVCVCVCVLIRGETKRPEGGRMICTLIPNILSMTVDVLHSDSQP